MDVYQYRCSKVPIDNSSDGIKYQKLEDFLIILFAFSFFIARQGS